MLLLVLGLVIFLGVHSVRIVAEDWRRAQIARHGANVWKAVIALASFAGLALIVWGYGLARAAPVVLWQSPEWLRLPVTLLMLVSFVLIAAAYVPRNTLKAAVGHPMLAGVKFWAFAHLLAHGRLAGLVLFGAFLVWAVFDFRAARARDRASGASDPAGTLTGDALTVLVGMAAWFVFARFLHGWLIGTPLAF
jgi:uncharacterized membrane protein